MKQIGYNLIASYYEIGWFCDPKAHSGQCAFWVSFWIRLEDNLGVSVI